MSRPYVYNNIAAYIFRIDNIYNYIAYRALLHTHSMTDIHIAIIITSLLRKLVINTNSQ